MVRPMVTSHKHIKQISTSTVAFGAAANENIVIAAQDPVRTASTNCAVGAIVKAIYVEMWVMGADNQPTAAMLAVEKRPSGLSVMSFADSQNLHSYPNKNNLFEIHQGLVGDANSNPTPFFRGWVKIPKGKQRMSIGDTISLTLTGIVGDVEYCGMFIWKEYQ